jgi:predicted dehydrogenase
MIRIGVLGTGRVIPYGLLAPVKETPGVEVSAVASRTPQRAEAFAARHGIQRGFGCYEGLLESGDIDAVYIALPPALHYDWARRAIEAGKHVLCEMPLAENARLAQELALSARRHGRVIVEAMHIRHLDRLRSQRELVDGGEFCPIASD